MPSSRSSIRRPGRSTTSTPTTASRCRIRIAGSRTTTRAETAAWVEAQNKVTFGYLEKIPYRKPLTERVIALNNYEKYSSPFRKGPYVFFSKNDGLQNQSVLYIQKGMRRHARRC